MGHVRSKKYFIFSSVKQLRVRTFLVVHLKTINTEQKKLEEMVPSFIWIRLLSATIDQKIPVLSHIFHARSNNFSFPEDCWNHCTVIPQAILEMSWLIDLRAQFRTPEMRGWWCHSLLKLLEGERNHAHSTYHICVYSTRYASDLQLLASVITQKSKDWQS